MARLAATKQSMGPGQRGWSRGARCQGRLPSLRGHSASGPMADTVGRRGSFGGHSPALQIGGRSIWRALPFFEHAGARLQFSFSKWYALWRCMALNRRSNVLLRHMEMQQHARPKNGNAATRTLVQRVETLSFFRCERVVQICLLAFERALPLCFASWFVLPACIVSRCKVQRHWMRTREK